jgi:hypothetical protein
MKMKINILLIALLISASIYAQKPTVSGTLGVSYEHYGLSLNPNSPTFYSPRRPWNQVRFNIAPTFNFGKNFSLPFNLNFATKPTNVLGAYGGLSALGRQNLGQFITNPMNNFSINPKYKNSELLLGTQYLNYSELTTGDIGVFGAGVDLKPQHYILKFFTGTSQQAINYSALPLVPGAYKRSNWMLQLGKENEGKYKVAFTMAKGKDKNNSTTPFPLPALSSPLPQEGFVLSFLTNVNFNKGFYVALEGAQGYYSNNTLLGPPTPGSIKSFEPFIKANTSTVRDFAGNFAFGKKSKNFDIGLKTKYLGAGFYTMGYPFQQPDKLDATINTRFNAWKDKDNNYKMNVVASVGNRINNFSSASLRANQLIANINWFTQFNDKFSLNVGYNNFGFNTNGSTLGLPTLKNVSNDISVNPTYTWSNSKMTNLLTLNYSYSKYKESIALPPLFVPTLTNNNTHTAMLSYIPTFFEKKASPDFSIMYFYNQLPGLTMQLFTISSGLSLPLAKDKVKLKGQLQYTMGKNASFTANNNFVASMSLDYAITKKINWNTFISSNYYKYGDELSPPPSLIGANYLESIIRTGINYRLK